MNKIFRVASFVLVMGVAISSASAETYQGTFTAATVDVFDGSAVSGTSFSTGSNGTPVVVDRGPSTSGAYGKARAALGSNGFLAESGAAGFSAWSDGFTVTGSGSGYIDVSVSIHGSITGIEADMSYGLYISKNPFSIDSEIGLGDADLSTYLAKANNILAYSIDNSNAPPNTTLTGKIGFTSGETFYIFSYLHGDVCTPLEDPSQSGCTGGSEDFYHSAVFGLTAPNSASVTTLSGHAYLAAVPESGSLALAMTGLLTLSVSWRRKNGSTA